MKYHIIDYKQVLKELNSDESRGLSWAEAQRRAEKFGRNEIVVEPPVSPWTILLNQFRDTIVHILLGAILFAMIAGEYADSMIILSILLMNAAIGFFQEWSAQRSIESLKKMAVPEAKVLRQGRPAKVAAWELVPGDIILIEAGDKIPADARLVESMHLRVAEDILTGESVPVTKHTQPIDTASQLGDQTNMVFSGTSVVSGHGKAVVTATGMHTELGKIAKLIRRHHTDLTPLQVRLQRFGQKLGIVIALICVTVFLLFVIRDYLSQELTIHSLTEFLFIAISLAVAAVPTALPAVVTIALSVGVKRLLKRKALVRRLSSVETLGSCDVICTDKTGTLTENRMSVRYAWSLEGEAELDGHGYDPQGVVRNGPVNTLLFEAGLVCNHGDVKLEHGQWIAVGDPTEAALVVSAARAGVRDRLEIVDELPFDSSRKRMSVLARSQDGSLTIFTKGAPDRVLECCKMALKGNDTVPLTSELRQTILKQNEEYANRALRVLGFAFRTCNHRRPNTPKIQEKDLVFIGLQAMMDPPRKDVPESVNRTKEAGIRVIMITGDYPATAKAVGYMTGIDGRVATGYELEEMDEKGLKDLIEQGTNIFARVAPIHKQRIVEVLLKAKHTVAMIGDGVNDAPALSRASIGVAVGSGTDVAKEAADFILMDDSFTNMASAIEEGRGIYDNIQKSIMLLLSGNLGEVLIIFLAAIAGLHLPLTATMLLWINMITDGAPALAYAVDPYDRNIMKRGPVPVGQDILPKPKVVLLLVLGTSGALIALALFALTGGASNDPNHVQYAQTMVFNYVIMYESVLVFAIRREYGAELFSNIWLWTSVIVSLSFQAVLMYTPLNTLFRLTPLTLSDIMILTTCTAGFAVICAIFHLWRRYNRQ